MIQTTLYFIFLDLRKMYDTVDRELLLEILEGYGVGLNVLGLLKFYWDHQCCVAKCGKYHREMFVSYRGASQGGVVSPTLFNVLVDAVVRKWWADVMDDTTIANTGLQGGDAGSLASFFMPMTVQLGPRTTTGYRMQPSISIICLGIAPV